MEINEIKIGNDSINLEDLFPTGENMGAAVREGPYVTRFCVAWLRPILPSGRFGSPVMIDLPYVGCTIRAPDGTKKYVEEPSRSFHIDQSGVIYPTRLAISAKDEDTINAIRTGIRDLQKRIRSDYPRQIFSNSG